MKYTTDELDLLNLIEAGEFESIENMQDGLSLAKKALKNTINQTKNINIQLSEADMEKLKAKSIEIGAPYQTIVSALIHNYNMGKVHLSI
ncbi:MAG: antitoxin [Campylobacterales bacterium]|nr:antitoxin [Campylobacterales bacterium]